MALVWVAAAVRPTLLLRQRKAAKAAVWFLKNLPLKNLPVLRVPEDCREPEGIGRFLEENLPGMEEIPAIVLPEMNMDYTELGVLAKVLARYSPDPLILAMEQDLAKALGQKLALELPGDRGLLCIDRVALGAQTYLDVGAPLGPARPVVVKTLVFGAGEKEREHGLR